MKKLYLFIWIFIVSINVFAQGENNNWFFGGGAAVNFPNGSSTITPIALNSTSSMSTVNITNSCQQWSSPTLYNDVGGSATVSKADGSLLFYTDGEIIYNKLHQQMVGLQPLYQYTAGISKQAAVIIPNPANSSQYFVISTCQPVVVSTGADQWGYYLAIVDFSSNVNGQIISSRQHFTSYCEGNQAITVTKNYNGDGFWILIPKGSNSVCPLPDSLLAYKVDNTGISSTPIINSLNNSLNNLGFYSEVKVSSNRMAPKISISGSTIAQPTISGGSPHLPKISVYNFDRQTGTISNSIFSYEAVTLSTEFSENGNLLYAVIDVNACLSNCNGVTQANRLVVFDLNNPTAPYRLLSNNEVEGSLQRAIDGNIYFTNKSNVLYRIDNQNSFTGSSISSTTINLGGKCSYFGLPQLIQTLGWPQQTCQPLTLTSEPNTIFTYTNYSNITAGTNYNIDQVRQDIKMYAKDYVVLKPNTYISYGKKYLAKIRNCETTVAKNSHGFDDETLNEAVIKDKQIIVYPNPSNSLITIKTNDIKFYKIEIISTDGRVVLNKNIEDDNSFQIDVSSLLKGIYIVTVETKDGTKYTEKLIKN